MPRELVLQDGVLSAVVKSFEAVELAQIEAELSVRKETTQNALEALGSVPADQSEALVLAAAEHAKAKEALEDTKSELSVAQSLVATLPQPESSESDDETGGGEFDAGAEGVDGEVESEEA